MNNIPEDDEDPIQDTDRECINFEQGIPCECEVCKRKKHAEFWSDPVWQEKV